MHLHARAYDAPDIGAVVGEKAAVDVNISVRHARPAAPAAGADEATQCPLTEVVVEVAVEAFANGDEAFGYGPQDVWPRSLMT